MKQTRICLVILFVLGIVRSAFAHSPVAPYVPGEMLVKVRSSAFPDKGDQVSAAFPKRLHSALEANGMLTVTPLSDLTAERSSGKVTGVRKSPNDNLFLLRFPETKSVKDLATRISSEPEVIFAEPNYIGSLCRSAPDILYASKQRATYAPIHIEEAWDRTTGSSDVTVAVLDSGIDLSHPEFGDGRVLAGFNFVDGSTDVQDRLGHGTRVAGIIGAQGGISGATSGMAGVCWDCRLLPVVVASSSEEMACDQVTCDVVVQAVDYAWRQGADVINMSFAFGGRSQALESICAAASQDALLVAAAGNHGQRHVPVYPRRLRQRDLGGRPR